MQRLSGSVRELRDRVVSTSATRTSARRKVRTPLELYTEMLKHLLEGGVTAQEIAHLSNSTPQSVQKFLKELKRQKLIYISGWQMKNNNRIRLPQYKLGDGVDKPKPERLPASVASKQWRDRQKVKKRFDPFFAICRPVAVSDSANPTKRTRAA
jgi:predicted transcriptional regulator